MIAKDLISESLPFLKPTDSVGVALSYMDNFRVSHLPVVNNMEYMGLVKDSELFDMNDQKALLESRELTKFKPYVITENHIFEVLRVASTFDLSVIPVINDIDQYKGSIPSNDLIKYISRISSVVNPGAIIVLEVDQRDYSMSQIAQIIEGNDLKILSLYITSPPETSLMEITIKLNSTDVNYVVKTFERYGYNIKSWVGNDDSVDHFFSERLDLLMKYLDI